MTAEIIYLRRPKKISFIDCTEGARKADVMDAAAKFMEEIERAKALYDAGIYDYVTKFNDNNDSLFKFSDAIEEIYGRDS